MSEKETKRRSEEFALRLALRSYCINNHLCSRASNTQYELMLNLFANAEEQDSACEVLDNLAAMLWICSDTEKTINRLSLELTDLYLNTLKA